MSRNKVIVKFPTLNDKGGDVSKQWYVEYYYYMPDEPAPRKRRIYTGLCSGTAEDRYAIAKRLISQYTDVLKAPNLLTARPEDTTKVLSDDTTTRPEADRYAAYQNAIQADNLVQSYIDYLQGSVAQKTHETYRSKLRIFANWLKQHELAITRCSKQSVIPFFQYLANERLLTKRSIFKYKQILHSFYMWVQENNYIVENPIKDIPAYGGIVDKAPAPMDGNERQLLKTAISKADPFLWLACEIQYYCAIRPNELRLLQVGDIDIQHMIITIRQANAKNRTKATIPINEQIAQLLVQLNIPAYDRELYIFGTYNIPASQPIGKNTLRNRFNKYRDDLGISNAIKFYSWKHTGAISMVENGVSVWELQHHLRHSSITTTEEYIRQRANQSRKAQDFIDEI